MARYNDEEDEEHEDEEELEDVLEEMEDDVDLAGYAEDGFSGSSFRSSGSNVKPFLEQDLDNQPVDNLDSLQSSPSRTSGQGEVEDGGDFSYSGVSSGYSQPESEAYSASYASVGDSESVRPSRNVDRQMDVTGGALRMDEGAIRGNIGFDGSQRGVNIGRFQEGMGVHQDRDYIARAERFETDEGLPFQRKEKKRY